ncbi:MAG: Hsp20/alpha crystallin family protein [Clostridia bacterium]
MKFLRPVQDDLFDGMFDAFIQPRNAFFSKNDLMKTDITEKDGHYLFEIDLAGFNKDDISLNIEDGYLEISAKSNQNKEKEEHGYIRRERTFGSCSRSYYVGDITEQDISAKFDNGILTVNVKKEEAKIPTAKHIAIE